MRAFWVAVEFLTCLPVPRLAAPSPVDHGRSVLFYPLVGLGIGFILAVGFWLTSGVDAMLAAALLLTAWVIVTGGLHLDGFADTVDAWIGGYGDREKTLAIMKDPHRGAAAIVGIVLLLLLKFSALTALLQLDGWPALLFAPVIARTSIVFLLLTTPYVRPGGIGAAHAEHLPRRSAVVVLIAALCAMVLLDSVVVVPLLVAAAVTLGLRYLAKCRLGGVTGDTLGASCEIIEAVVLVASAVTFDAIAD